MLAIVYQVRTFSLSEFCADQGDRIKRKLSRIQIDPFFFTRPYEFNLLGHEITWYRLIKVRCDRMTNLDQPSFITSAFLTTHATFHFFSFVALTGLDFTANLFRLKINPIGDLPLKIGREQFGRNKATLFKLFFDEMGKFAKLSYIHSAQDFQKAIQYFPIQIQTLKSKNIFENRFIQKPLFVAFKYFFIAKVKLFENLVGLTQKIERFSPNQAIQDEKKYFEKSLNLAQENLSMIYCLEDLEEPPLHIE